MFLIFFFPPDPLTKADSACRQSLGSRTGRRGLDRGLAPQGGGGASLRGASGSARLGDAHTKSPVHRDKGRAGRAGVPRRAPQPSALLRAREQGPSTGSGAGGGPRRPPAAFAAARPPLPLLPLRPLGGPLSTGREGTELAREEPAQVSHSGHAGRRRAGPRIPLSQLGERATGSGGMGGAGAGAASHWLC